VEVMEVVPNGKLIALPSHLVTNPRAQISLYLSMLSLTTLAVTQDLPHSRIQKRQNLWEIKLERKLKNAIVAQGVVSFRHFFRD